MLKGGVFFMNLKEFIEKKFECDIDLNNNDLDDFLYYYDVNIYRSEELLKEELSADLMIDDWLMDFIDIPKLAEYQNFTVLDDCYVDNNGLHYFSHCFDDYGRNIEDMINDWRE